MTELLVVGLVVVVVYLHNILRALDKQRADALDQRERWEGVQQANAHLDAIARGENPPFIS